MSSDAEETQFINATRALEEFLKILVKEYPLVFKDGCGCIKINPSTQQTSFPYVTSLKIKKPNKNTSKVSTRKKARAQ